MQKIVLNALCLKINIMPNNVELLSSSSRYMRKNIILFYLSAYYSQTRAHTEKQKIV